MDLSMALTAAVALGLALVLMYAVLKKYTYPAIEGPFFSDPTFFILFTVGLVEGTILFVLYTYILPWYTDLGIGMFVAMMFGAIMEIVKLVTLNLKRFNGKSDSIFYGFGLGLGMGAAMAFGFAYYMTSRTALDPASYVVVGVFIVQYILLHAGTGTIIGEGIARYKPWEFLLQAFLVAIVFQLLMVPTYAIPSTSDIYWLSYVTMGLALLLVIVNFYHRIYVKLPRVVDEVLRMNGKKRDDIPGL